MLSSLMTTQMKILAIVLVVIILFLYVLSIIWVIRDAYARGANHKLWGIVALVPFAGALAYILLRPQLLMIDKDEQELEIALKQRELLKFGECSNCGYPVQENYLVCPNCQQSLKKACTKCGAPLNYQWAACPYCATPVVGNNPNFAPVNNVGPNANAANNNAAATNNPVFNSPFKAGVSSVPVPNNNPEVNYTTDANYSPAGINSAKAGVSSSSAADTNPKLKTVKNKTNAGSKSKSSKHIFGRSNNRTDDKKTGNSSNTNNATKPSHLSTNNGAGGNKPGNNNAGNNKTAGNNGSTKSKSHTKTSSNTTKK